MRIPTVRMVVDDDKIAAIPRRAHDPPLGSSLIDGSFSMLTLDHPRHVTCVQIAFVESIGCVFRPDKTNDSQVARVSAWAG